MNDGEKSSVRVLLGEVYELADKRLAESKEDLILRDMETAGVSTGFIFDKIKLLKAMIIKGVKFDTAFVYRVLQLGQKHNSELPKGCNRCDDGYITDTKDTVYACGCELGKHRKRTEKIKYFDGREISDNLKIKRNEYTLSYKENAVYKALKSYFSINDAVVELAVRKRW